MTPHRRHILLALMLSVPAAHAEDDLQNRGHDPFFQISAAIPGCPEPAGPRVSEAEWKRESHHRIEHGNHCWVEGDAACPMPSPTTRRSPTARAAGCNGCRPTCPPGGRVPCG